MSNNEISSGLCLFDFFAHLSFWGRVGVDFPGGSAGKSSAYNAGDPGLTPGSGRSPGGGNGNPLQYSCLENPLDGGGYSPWGPTESGTTSLSLWGRRVPRPHQNPLSLLHFEVLQDWHVLFPYFGCPWWIFCLDFSGCGYFLCFLLFFPHVHVISYTYTSSPYEHIY